MAETEGFEPSVPDLPVRRFSKPLVSATHPRLRMARRKCDGVGLSGAYSQPGGSPQRLRFGISRLVRRI